jgi:uncharacterized membrane protein YhaH (DUF805 family)
MGLAICVDQTAKFYSRKETNMFLATLDASGVNTATLAIIILVSSLVGLVGFIFAIIVYWRIFAKAGYSGALGLLMFVPIANIVMLCVLAFGEWPIYRELNYLRQMAARGPQYQPPPQQFSSSPQYPQYGQPQPPQYPQG